jgi:hypothetical protein
MNKAGIEAIGPTEQSADWRASLLARALKQGFEIADIVPLAPDRPQNREIHLVGDTYDFTAHDLPYTDSGDERLASDYDTAWRDVLARAGGDKDRVRVAHTTVATYPHHLFLLNRGE